MGLLGISFSGPMRAGARNNTVTRSCYTRTFCGSLTTRVGRGIAKRTTGKRRKARAEDRAGVDQIGVADDAFRQRRFRFGDEGADQARGEPLRNACGGLSHRLAVHILVEAALRL